MAFGQIEFALVTAWKACYNEESPESSGFISTCLASKWLQVITCGGASSARSPGFCENGSSSFVCVILHYYRGGQVGPALSLKRSANVTAAVFFGYRTSGICDRCLGRLQHLGRAYSHLSNFRSSLKNSVATFWIATAVWMYASLIIVMTRQSLLLLLRA